MSFVLGTSNSGFVFIVRRPEFQIPKFIVDAPKAGSGGKCALCVDGQQVATGRIPKTQPYAFSADEGADVGVDNETMVSNDYKPGENKFTGKIISVTIDTKPSNLNRRLIMQNAGAGDPSLAGFHWLIVCAVRTVPIGLKSHCHRQSQSSI